MKPFADEPQYGPGAYTGAKFRWNTTPFIQVERFRNGPNNYNFPQLFVKTGDKAPHLHTPVSAPGTAGRTKDTVRGQTDLGSEERVRSHFVLHVKIILLN